MTQVAIQLPDDLSKFVEETVQAGGYPSTDDFFISVVSMYKDQVEVRLSEADEAKLAALRTDIQTAVEQADRSEVIRDFQMDDFLAARHRERTTLKSA